jgi:hypothetical protein
MFHRPGWRPGLGVAYVDCVTDVADGIGRSTRAGLWD